MEGNEYLKFKYELPDMLLNLVRNDVTDFTGNKLTGYMNKSYISSLHHVGLYLVCSAKNLVHDDSGISYNNALGIIAKNENDAIVIYSKITGSDNGTCLCEIANRCDKLEVEQVE